MNTGPIVNTQAYSAERLAAHEARTNVLGTTISQLQSHADEDRSFIVAAQRTVGNTVGSYLRRAGVEATTDEIYDKFLKPGAQGAALAAGAAIAGSMIYKRHRARSRANEPILQQPTQIKDYLATAGVTRVLDENRIGHHRMGHQSA